ncbi:hypothetical protein F5888DRAFT_1630297 [Russula emetica]|nr:hypothetical protein F5888DRAFT_1630297 [Russula emetica]
MSGCAVASDGSLLSPSKIDFYNDPDDAAPIFGPSLMAPTVPSASISTSSATTLDNYFASHQPAVALAGAQEAEGHIRSYLEGSGPEFSKIGERNLGSGPRFTKFLKEPDQTGPRPHYARPLEPLDLQNPSFCYFELLLLFVMMSPACSVLFGTSRTSPAFLPSPSHGEENVVAVARVRDSGNLRQKNASENAPNGL